MSSENFKMEEEDYRNDNQFSIKSLDDIGKQ